MKQNSTDFYLDNEVKKFEEEEVFVFPCSYSQQRLWFIDKFQPESSVYNLPIALYMKGYLNVEAINKSVNEILKRHEILRTTFNEIDGKPVQIVDKYKEIVIPVVDMTKYSKSEKEFQTNKWLKEEAHRPFNLNRGPLFRVNLLKKCESEYVLMLNMHHIISDGWSMEILAKNIASFYKEFCSGGTCSLSELSIQYADFAVWQREWLQGEVLEKQLSYWKKQLGGDLPILNLPTDRPRPAKQSFKGGVEKFKLSKSLTQGIKKLGQQEGSTLYMTLLAGFKTLLYRYTGQLDILVGTAVSNRNARELEELIGFFVNTLIIRTDLSENMTFKDLLAKVCNLSIEAHAHQDLPFEKIVQELQPERNISYSPVAQTMFVLQNNSYNSIELPELIVNPVEIHTEVAKFDLTLSMEENVDELVGIFEYSIDLFDKITIQNMISNFIALLEGVVKNPNQCLSELPLLTDYEQQMLLEWNKTETEYPKDECVHQLFQGQVELYPDTIAVTYEDKHISYSELNYKANQLAHYLKRFGVGPDVLVGIHMERSVDMIIGLLGILKAGGAYVPLDTTYPKERLAFMLEDSKVPILLTQERLVEGLPEHNSKIVSIDTDWINISKESSRNLDVNTTPENLAYIIYTSGSTGRPKGVCVPHKAINRLVCNTNYVTFQHSFKVAQASNTSFDAATFEIWGALLNGAELIGITKDIILSPRSFAEEIKNQGINILFLTPALFNQIVSEVPTAFQSIQYVVLGGDVIDPKAVKQVFKYGSPENLLNGYGPTENTTFSTWYSIQETLEEGKTIPIGRPISNTQTYILDNKLQLVPIGIPGELYVGGEGVARGYLNQPELTEEKFILNPFVSDSKARLYKTGDLVRYLPDGNIEFLGRIDNQVKIRGFRIELFEIESVLGEHQAVQETVVMARIDKETKDKYLVGYVILKQEYELSVFELRNYLKEKLPEYMIPTAFVLMDSFPLNANGKVDKKLLPEPDQINLELEVTYVGPRSPIEELLVDIWSEILKIEKIGIYDNFFDLGGHSLLATQVTSRIRDVLQIELPLRTFFENPTVAGILNNIEKMKRDSSYSQDLPIQPVTREENLPLSFAQQRLWFLDQLEPGNVSYNIPVAISFKGTLNVQALNESINEIIRRHEILRTVFKEVEGKPVQVVTPFQQKNIEVIDLTKFVKEKKEYEKNELIKKEAHRAFDLNKGPLIRECLIKLDEFEHILMLNMHHIISDGWSMDVIIKELSTLYEDFCSGGPSSLSELSIQYADFAVWQRDWLQAGALEKQLTYWKEQLGGELPVLNLPIDRPRTVKQTYQGSVEQLVLSKQLTQKVRSLSKQEGTTLFMTLLAAFKTLLYRYTGQEDIIVGSPIANRNRSEIEGLVGFFVNTLPLRTKLSGDKTFREVLKLIRETSLEAYAHQDVPFEKLVEEIHPEREMGYSPLFNVMFVVQNDSTKIVKSSDVNLVPFEIQTETAKFDMTLCVHEDTEGLIVEIEYNTNLFFANTIKRMINHFNNLIQAFLENPNQSISTLSILTEKERYQLLTEWNNTEVTYQDNHCLHHLFEEQVIRTPENIAVVYQDKTLTYDELNKKANQLAHYLKIKGVGPDIPVGVRVERSLDLVISILGVLKAGGAYVPLEIDAPSARIAQILEDSKSKVCLTQGHLNDVFPNEVIVVCIDKDSKEIEDYPEYSPETNVTAEHLVSIYYTSGSTGKPKGVANIHRGWVNRMNWMQRRYQLKETETVLQKTTLTFDDAAVEFFWPLMVGGRIAMLEPELHKDPQAILNAAVNYEVAVLQFVPSMLTAFLDSVDQKSQIKLTSLRHVISSGEALHPEVVKMFFERIRCNLYNQWGATEVSIDSTAHVCSLSEANQEVIVPVGRPIDNNQVYILDKHLQPVPIGVAGDLYLSGVGLARGYLNDPKRTNEAFISNPFVSNTLMYKTGDKGYYRSDGAIVFLGRLDNQVKIRGIRIELGEIETVLMEHLAVREATVIAISNSVGEKRLVAYLVIKQGNSPTRQELRSFLKEKLPEYMHPSAYVFLDSFPLTTSGKVDRKCLPVPDLSKIETEQKYVAPSNEEEILLVDIWKQVLGIEKIGIHDNFFELGGHSLLATQVISKIRKIFEVNIPVRAIFEKPTILELGKEIVEYIIQEIDQLTEEETNKLLK